MLVLYGYHSLTVSLLKSRNLEVSLPSNAAELASPYVPLSKHTVILGPFGTQALAWGWGMANSGGSSSSGEIGTAPGVLDLGGYSQELVQLPAGGADGTSDQPRLYLHNMVLRGLYSSLLPGQPEGGTSSALPLWALAASDRSKFSSASISSAANDTTSQVPVIGTQQGPLLALDSVVIVLPKSDYSALLAAAMRGTLWKQAATATAPILAGIVTFSPSVPPAAVPPDSSDATNSYVQAAGIGEELSAFLVNEVLLQELSVAAFEGWGWAGSNIKVRRVVCACVWTEC